jgi:acetyl/propionyl-CoA carboxylase alpha subunit
MLRALAEYRIAGIKHNIPALRRVLAHPAFIAGDLSTHFLTEHNLLGGAAGTTDGMPYAAMAAAIFAARRQQGIRIQNGGSAQASSDSRWRAAGRRWALRQEQGH